MLTAAPPYPPIAALCRVAKTPLAGTLPIMAWAPEAKEPVDKGQNLVLLRHSRNEGRVTSGVNTLPAFLNGKTNLPADHVGCSPRPLMLA
jgi:hypothetical protein